MSYTIINDNNITHLATLEDNSIDSIITDPPYGIEFLGKDWDTNTGAVETWRQCLRVLKPGGYLLAFSAARTYHILATNIQSVGFEIRDQLMWLYASGFPKAQDIGKAIEKRGNNGQQWAGWKTAVKPAHEPIVMARKPFRGSTIDNVLTHGVGALNIDASRISTTDTRSGGANGVSRLTFGEGETSNEDSFKQYTPNEQGRFPSNVLGEVEHYQKYFYCPKVSRRERHVGFEQTESVEEMLASVGGYKITNEGNSNMCYIPDVGKIYVHGLKHEVEKIRKNKDPHRASQIQVGNNHPTVKPVELMKYLIRLVTPPNSTVLDPFCGSGSTGMAAVELGHTFTGIELDADYVEIAKKRIAGWNQPQETGNTYNELFEEHDA